MIVPSATTGLCNNSFLSIVLDLYVTFLYGSRHLTKPALGACQWGRIGACQWAEAISEQFLPSWQLKYGCTCTSDVDCIPSRELSFHASDLPVRLLHEQGRQN